MKKSFKKSFFFLTAIVIFIPHYIQPQTFEKIYRSNLDDAGYDAIELPNGNFLVVINRGNYYTSYADFMFLTLDKNTGSFIDSLVYFGSKDYHYFGVSHLFSINDSIYVCCRVCENLGYHYLNFIKFNSQFNVILDTIVGNAIPQLYLFDYLLTSKDKIVVSACETINNVFFLYVFDLIQNSMSYHPIIDTGGNVNQFPMVIYDIPEENEYRVYMRDVNNSIYEINKSNYSIDTSYTYSPQLFFPKEAKQGFNDSTYLVGGEFMPVFEARFVPAYFTISNHGNIYDFHFYDLENDTNTYLFADCFVIANNRIYMAVTYNFTSPYMIYPEQRWIWLMCLSSNGTLDWQRFYKGDVDYMPFKLLPASDGGLLIVSNKYDWNDPIPNQRDVHILKVDSTGWYNGMTTGLSDFDQPKQILVYPNPVKNQVKFVLGFYSGLQLKIYNSNGKLVRNETLEHSASIDLSEFPKGLYVYVLEGNYGFNEKGKLIKQ